MVNFTKCGHTYGRFLNQSKGYLGTEAAELARPGFRGRQSDRNPVSFLSASLRP